MAEHVVDFSGVSLADALAEVVGDDGLIREVDEELGGLHTDRVVGAEVAAKGIDADKLERMKATFAASGGNLSEVARVHGVDARQVGKLAVKHDWPVYGVDLLDTEKTRKTRLIALADALEQQIFTLAEALGVERKALDDPTDRGLNSVYVASLSQRSGAFSAVFDRWMRVMALIEPETFAADDSPSGALARQRAAGPDALGGVDGVNRQLADFAVRLGVGIARELQHEGGGDDRGVIDLTG